MIRCADGLHAALEHAESTTAQEKTRGGAAPVEYAKLDMHEFRALDDDGIKRIIEGKLKAHSVDAAWFADARVPDGTYTVREIEAPAGYALSSDEYEVTVSGHDAVVDAQDTPVTVTFRLKKTDAETGEATPQGAASLDGAVYEASFEQNGKTKTVRGTTQNGEVVSVGRV